MRLSRVSAHECSGDLLAVAAKARALSAHMKDTRVCVPLSASVRLCARVSQCLLSRAGAFVCARARSRLGSLAHARTHKRTRTETRASETRLINAASSTRKVASQLDSTRPTQISSRKRCVSER